MVDLVGGSIQLIFATVSTAVSSIKAGKIRPLAVTTVNRVELFPELPTVAEAGVLRLARRQRRLPDRIELVDEGVLVLEA